MTDRPSLTTIVNALRSNVNSCGVLRVWHDDIEEWLRELEENEDVREIINREMEVSDEQG